MPELKRTKRYVAAMAPCVNSEKHLLPIDMKTIAPTHVGKHRSWLLCVDELLLRGHLKCDKPSNSTTTSTQTKINHPIHVIVHYDDTDRREQTNKISDKRS